MSDRPPLHAVESSRAWARAWASGLPPTELAARQIHTQVIAEVEEDTRIAAIREDYRAGFLDTFERAGHSQTDGLYLLMSGRLGLIGDALANLRINGYENARMKAQAVKASRDLEAVARLLREAVQDDGTRPFGVGA